MPEMPLSDADRLLALAALMAKGASSYFWRWRPREQALLLAREARAVCGDPDSGAVQKLAHWKALVEPASLPAIELALAQCHAGAREQSILLRVRGNGGQWRQVEWRSLLTQWDGSTGQPLELVGVIRDIQHEQLTDQLIEARGRMEAAERASREKNLFLANISHDIRTPINAILGLASLTGSTALSREQAEYLRLIRTSAESVVGILSNGLDFSRIEAGCLELDAVDFSPRRMFSDTLRALAFEAQQKGLEVILGIAPEVPDYIRGDATRIKQILINLFQNASKFTASGEISVTLGAVRRAQGLALTIAVQDTGCGISEAAISKIFEAYSQADSSIVRHYGGAGLGLSICRRLAELMQGSLHVESILGQGSLFRAELLCAEALAAGRPIAAGDALAGQQALVICAHTGQAQVLATLLRELGAVASIAPDIASAGDYLQQTMAAGAAVDWVFADFPLLLSAPGEQLAEIRKGRQKGLLAVTGVQQSIDELPPSSRCCVDGAILKPLSSLDIVEAVSAVQDTGSFLSPPDLDGRTLMEPQQQKKRILIAEDNPVSRRVTAMLLEKAGYQVDTVGDGKEAVDHLEHCRFATDLVIMDLQMPRLDGIAATQAIRMHEMRRSWVMDFSWSQLPILGLTGDVTADTLRRCTAAGMTQVLTKPVRPDALIETIGEMLRRKPEGEGPDQQQMGEMAKLIQSQIDPKQVFGKVQPAAAADVPMLVPDETAPVDSAHAWFGWDTSAFEQTGADFVAVVKEVSPLLRKALQLDDRAGFAAALGRLKATLGLLHAETALQAADQLAAVALDGNPVRTDQRFSALVDELNSVANELKMVGEK